MIVLVETTDVSEAHVILFFFFLIKIKVYKRRNN